jgi:type IV pilus assembly protein PilO
MMEKFKSIAWHWQLLILVGIASLLYLGVYHFLISGVVAETQTINDQVSQLQAKNQAAQIATQRINEFRSLYASKSAEYDELKVLLPEEREITNVLSGLQDTARESRLIVMRFSPREDTQQDGFMSKPVEVEVDSNFTNLRAFFEKMAKLQRIVSISDFNLKQLEKQTEQKTLHAQFLLTAYYASPETLTAANTPQQQPANGAKPNAPGQKPAANAPTAPAAK